MKNTKKQIFKVLILMALALNSFAQVQTTLPISKTNTAAIVKALETKIDLEPIAETLCPSKVERGDREFGGHGPRIKSEVKIRLANDGTEIWADISFSAQETEGDFSTTSGKWSKKVYDAPYGKKITKIMSDQASRTAFVSPSAGAQFLVPGTDIAGTLNTLFEGGMISKAIFSAFGIPTPGQMKSAIVAKLVSSYTKGNTVIVVPPLEGTLVKFFHIVGDTGGDDISTDNNCNDDTRIEKIEFFPVRVMLVNR